MKLNAHLDIDLVAVETTDSVTVMLDLEAPPAPTSSTPRPAHTAIVVLDRSGSMYDGRLTAAKRALIDLVSRLDDRDNFGLVTFDHEATVVVPAGRLGDLGRDRVRAAISGIDTGGATDLSSGYLRGLQEARRVATAAGATVVLLSDGHANAGVTDPQRLRGIASKAATQGVSTSTIGIGLGYDEAILADVATGGTGNHSFAQNPDDAAAAVAAEIDGLLSKTAQAASLLVAPSGDVSAVTILNDVVANPVENGILVELGDFYAGEQRRITLTIDVPAMAALGLCQVATLTVTHVEVATLEQHSAIMPVTVNVVPLDIARGRVPSPDVTREKLFLAAQKAKRSVEDALRAGDVETAQSRLASAANMLSNAELDELGEELAEEINWLKTTEGTLDYDEGPDIAYASKRLSSDRTRKSRGYKSRSQGGETHRPDLSDGDDWEEEGA